MVTGTAIAQAIPLALSPILTRLYSPEDFGIFALFMSLFSIISVTASLKYEIAIMLPEKDEDATTLMVISVLLSLAISIVLLLLVILFNSEIVELLTNDNTQEELSNWLYFIPVSVFFMGVFNALSFWLNRKSYYKDMAGSKVLNSSGMIGLQMVAGSLKYTPKGLLFGFLAGRVLSVLYLFRSYLKKEPKRSHHLTRKHIKEMLSRYRRFPVYTLPGEFINVFSNQLPVLVVGRYFGGGILGNYALMERILNAPISLLGRSVLDVFKQKASKDYILTGNCEAIFVKTFRTLALLAIGPTILLFFVAPHVFGYIFGPEWVQAGEFARILSVLFFFRFIASPLSYMFNIAEKQNFDLLWQIGLLLVTILSFIIGISRDSIELALICFTTAYSLMYILNLYMSYSFSKGSKTKMN